MHKKQNRKIKRKTEKKDCVNAILSFRMAKLFSFFFIEMVTNEGKKWLLQIFPYKWRALNANTFTVELMWLLESTIGGYNVIHDNEWIT